MDLSSLRSVAMTTEDKSAFICGKNKKEKTMKIGIVGCMGRVGSLLTQEILSGAIKGVALAGGTALPADIPEDSQFFITSDADELFSRADAVIDFTIPEASRTHIALAAKHKKILVLATTGFTADDEASIAAAAKETTIIHSANFSIAVNMLEALVEKTAASLGTDFDIEIIEAHHKHKIDAPSGTAIMLGRAAAAARGQNFDDVSTLSREGITGPRTDGEIGFSTIRGADVVGEHTVYFLGEGERLELKQQATNRALYARGALRAALWAAKQKPGLYSMRDVLGL